MTAASTRGRRGRRAVGPSAEKAKAKAQAKAPPLRRLQSWFAHVVQHPGTSAQALAEPAAQRLVPTRALATTIAANPRLDAASMLDVYNGGYLARLVEVMQGDFGAVHRLLGDDAFRALVARYLQRHPSRHPNLNRLGRAFPAFVATQRRLPQRAFLAELAQLELAVSRAFDAAEFTPLAASALQAVPAAHWDRVRFVPNPSLQLLVSRHPVDRAYQAWKDGAPLVVPAPERSWLLVHRRDDRVWRQRLVPGQFAVLQALFTGAPLATALAKAPKGAPVGEWFAACTREGWFTALRRGR